MVKKLNGTCYNHVKSVKLLLSLNTWL